MVAAEVVEATGVITEDLAAQGAAAEPMAAAQLKTAAEQGAAAEEGAAADQGAPADQGAAAEQEAAAQQEAADYPHVLLVPSGGEGAGEPQVAFGAPGRRPLLGPWDSLEPGVSGG